LLAKVQTELISQQVERWLAGQTHCESCGAALRHKDSRSTAGDEHAQGSATAGKGHLVE
jgi:hypothetical protein